MFFWNSLIYRRVWAVIKTRIAAAQKAYDEEVDRLHGAHKETVSTLEQKLEQDKAAAADVHVQSILGRII